MNASANHGPKDARLPGDPRSPKCPYKLLLRNASAARHSEIRLLKLKPGFTSSPIECTIQNATIIQARSSGFKALSYAWGPPERIRTIHLEGRSIEVRENLWQALYHLRSYDAELCLWVDALCINQDDVEERNSQVSMMGLIYSEASEVLSWLGPESDSSRIAMEFLHSVGTLCSSSSHLPIELIAGSTALLEALEFLVRRDYWKRSWIIQEILKARQVTIHCGYQTLHWESLAKFFSQIRSIVFEPDEIFKTWHDPFRPRLESLGQSLPARLTRHTRSNERSLEELLEVYKDSLSSDARDKVYSLIGLSGGKLCTPSKDRGDSSLQRIDPEAVGHATTANELIPIDYSISALELFRILVLKFDFQEPGSSLQVKRMQLIQETLGLQPSLPKVQDIRSKSNLPEENLSGTLITARDCITALGDYRSTISDCALFWYCKTRIKEQNSGKSWLWHDTELMSPSLWKCLQSANDKNMRRLGIEQHSWETSSFRVFIDSRGHMGLAGCCVQVGDRIIQFHPSAIALIVRGSKQATVVGRAVFLNHEAERNLKTQEYITLPLSVWQSLIW